MQIIDNVKFCLFIIAFMLSMFLMACSGAVLWLVRFIFCKLDGILKWQ